MKTLVLTRILCTGARLLRTHAGSATVCFGESDSDREIPVCCCSPMLERVTLREPTLWLGDQDSNLDRVLQRHLTYHWSIAQWVSLAPSIAREPSLCEHVAPVERARDRRSNDCLNAMLLERESFDPLLSGLCVCDRPIKAKQGGAGTGERGVHRFAPSQSEGPINCRLISRRKGY